jgi:hypothetical protein
MQPADDVKLGDRLAVSLAGLLDALVDSHFVSARLVDLARPGAESAVHPAEVRRVEVPVDVVISHVAVPALAGRVGQAPEPQEVPGREEPDAVLEGQAFSGGDLLREVGETGVPGPRGGLRDQRMAGLVTGWKGFWASGATSSTNGWMYR